MLEPGKYRVKILYFFSNCFVWAEVKGMTFGMTSAINVAMPKEADIALSTRLEEYLRESNMFESEADMNHRFEVLSKLNVLVKDWIKNVSLTVKNMPPQVTTFIYSLTVGLGGAD